MARVLSPREIEILTLVKEGQSNKQIGLTLHISGQTAKNHLYMIFRKLDVTSRTEAVVKAIKMGLIDLGGGS